MCYDKFERQQIKRGAGLPTIPASTDHRNGDWIATDIYEGELYMDTNTGQTYTRYGSTIITAGKGAENFANADLTLTANRTHDLDALYLALMNGNVIINSGYNGTALSVSTSDTLPAMEVSNSNGAEIAFTVTNGRVNLTIADVYATDALAGAAGVPTNTVYMTPTGELRIKL